MSELKEHPWFDGFDWNALASKTMQPVFVPSSSVDNFDAIAVNKDFKKQIDLSKPVVQSNFKDYFYDRDAVSKDRSYVQVKS